MSCMRFGTIYVVQRAFGGGISVLADVPVRDLLHQLLDIVSRHQSQGGKRGVR